MSIKNQTMYRPIVFNIGGGPGISKSTTASALFAECKYLNMNCELVGEYAKTKTWEKTPLGDQLYILGKQQHAMQILRGQVDLIITDSPLFMMHYYNNTPYSFFGPLVDEVIDSYYNINVLLERVKPYHQVGRGQTEAQAREIDESLKALLYVMTTPVHQFRGERESIDGMLTLIKSHMSMCELIAETKEKEAEAFQLAYAGIPLDFAAAIVDGLRKN